MENYGQAVLVTGRRGVGKTTVCQAVAQLARRRGYRPGGVITPALYACPELVLSEVEGRSRRACPELVLSKACPEPRRRVEGQSRRACPADWELGIWDLGFDKVGFEAVDVGSGERWPLARTDPSTGSGRGPSTTLRPASETPPTGHRRELGGPRVGPYIFDPAGLARALRVLRRACPEPVLSKACPEPRRRVEGQSRRAVAAGCDLLIVDEIGPLELEQGEGFAPILELLPVEGPTHTLIVVRPAFVDQLLLHLRIQSLQVFNVTEENRDELPLRIVEELWGDGCLS